MLLSKFTILSSRRVLFTMNNEHELVLCTIVAFIFVPDRSNRSGNVFMWVALFIGMGILMCFYSMEWYARQTCLTLTVRPSQTPLCIPINSLVTVSYMFLQPAYGQNISSRMLMFVVNRASRMSYIVSRCLSSTTWHADTVLFTSWC